MSYKDHRGYKREHSNAVHRHRAYHHIYLKNRKKYPLNFEAYEVHHIDGDKTNNRMDNLDVLTPEEHDNAHEEMDKLNLAMAKERIKEEDENRQKVEEDEKLHRIFGLYPEEVEGLLEKAKNDYGINQEEVFTDFDDLKKELFRDFLELGSNEKYVKFYDDQDFDDEGIDEEEYKEAKDYASDFHIPIFSFESNYADKEKKIKYTIEKYVPPVSVLVKTWVRLGERYEQNNSENKKEEKRIKEDEEGRKEREKIRKERIEKGKKFIGGIFKRDKKKWKNAVKKKK
jgi:hypothetical protein